VSRDPGRISEVLAEVEAAWRKRPDWRLGQLIYNAARESNPGMTPLIGPDIFSIDDDKLLANIKRMNESAEKTIPRHNHMTRDIKPEGQCPSCDLYWAGVRR
jgi:uncharacterized protein YihD (DUF1040 family)